MWYCDTDELPAVRTGNAVMRHGDDETFHLCEKLMMKIKAIKETGELTLKVTSGRVTAIGLHAIESLAKFKTND